MRRVSIFVALMFVTGLVFGQPLSNIDIGELYDCPCNEIFSMYVNNGELTVNCNSEKSYQFMGNEFVPIKDTIGFKSTIRYYYSIHPQVDAMLGHEISALRIRDSLIYLDNNPYVVQNESNEQYITILDFPYKYKISLDDLSQDTFLMPYQTTQGLEGIDFTKDRFLERYEDDTLVLFNKEKKYTYFDGIISESDEFYSSWEFFTELDPTRYFLNSSQLNCTKTKQLLTPEKAKSFGLIGKRNEEFKDSVEYFVIAHKGEAHLQKLVLHDEASSRVGQWESGLSYWFDYLRPELLFSSDNNSCKMIYKDVLSYTQKELGQTKTIHAIYEVDGDILIGMYGKGFQALNNKPLQYEYSLGKQVDKILPGSIEYEGKSFGINESLSCIHYFKKSMHDLHTLSLIVDNKPTLWKGYYLDTLRDGRLAIGMEKNGLGILDSMNGEHFYVTSIGKEKGFGLGNVIGFEQDQSGNIWMGRSSKGVAVYSSREDTVYNYLRSEHPDNIGANNFEIDHEENMWLAGHNGLYYLENPSDFHPGKDSLHTKLRKIDLPNMDTSFVSLIRQVKQYLFFGNSTAISIIDLNDFYNKKDAFPIYQYRFGYDIIGKGTSQNTIHLQDDRYVWIACNDAVHRFDLENLFLDQSTTKIAIRSIKSSGKEVVPKDGKLKLDISERNIKMSIGMIKNEYLLNNVFYSYQLIDQSNDQVFTSVKKINKPELYIEYLPPGTYSFNIQAYKHGLKMDEKSLEIYVKPTLHETKWFYPMLLLSAILFPLFFYLYQRRRNHRFAREKEKLELELNKTKVQAVLSAFNPHFINNSLHWVQSKYSEDKDLTTVVERLSKNLTKLVKANKAGKPYHTLTDELELVENYVEIQKIRFSKSFVFEIKFKENDQDVTNIKVPIMQLQIHVENAIEHGLRNRSQSTFVRIEIEEEGEHVLLRVIDDGIGRARAHQLRSKRTQAGTAMLWDLQAALNSFNEQKISTTYIDHIYGDYGTEVVIQIPKNFYYG